MRVVVLVKQVPMDGSVRMEDGRLMRDTAPGVLNPMCEYALDLAMRTGGEVIALSMGPPQAGSSLIRCLELGAERAILLTGREFAGSDVLATSTALSAAIGTIGDVDLVLTGQRAIDGDTGQVPVEVATMLDIPFVLHCSDVSIENGEARLVTECDGSRSVIVSDLPLLAAVSWGSNVRRIPSMGDFVRADSIGVESLSADDIGVDHARCGSKGSMTDVVRTFSPRSSGDSERIFDQMEALDALVTALRGDRG